MFSDCSSLQINLHFSLSTGAYTTKCKDHTATFRILKLWGRSVSEAMISLHMDIIIVMIPGVDKCINNILSKQVGIGTSEGLDDYVVCIDCCYWPPGHTDTRVIRPNHTHTAHT